MKKLYLVDVSSMFFRAFFALPRLSNEKGMPTNALYGFYAMAVKLLREIKPDYIAFCFDTKEPSFRNEIYDDYKANRDEMPSDLVPQVPYVKTICQALGAPVVEMPGFEADDIIGTLTHQGRKHGLEVVIVSGDKDFAQLVGSHVSMYDTMKEVRYDTDGVVAKWGVRPGQMIDYLSLVGDTSDNIPGVRGIGPKGAQKLLSDYKTLEGVYENLEGISSKSTKAKLVEGKDSALLSKRLVAIKCDIDLGLKVEELKLKSVEREGLHQLLLELGFKTFARKLMGDESEAAEETKPKMAKAKTEASAPEVKVSAPRSRTKSTKEIKERQVSLAEADKLIKAYSDVWGLLDERGIYFGVGSEVLLIAEDAERLGDWLSGKQINWKGFDLKSIWHWLKINNPIASWDSMLAAYILRASNIEDFAKVYGDYLGRPLPDLLSPVELYQLNLELAEELEKILAEKNLRKVLDELELPLIPVLYSMERQGILLDQKELANQSQSLITDLSALEKTIYGHAGGSFNISSPKQLAQILFGKLKLPPGKKTKTGYSTDSDVLEGLKDKHAIAETLIEYRELSKLKSTYVDALPGLINQKTGRIHTNFRQASTSTGRLSSINPNLQNIPIRTERGRKVRACFIADKDCQLISADYSQIELRVLAHVSDDKALQAAFASDQDIHATTASEIFGVPLNDVTPELRRRAKAVNFGIAYGQGAFGLSESLGISRQEATDIINRYFLRFKGVNQFMQETILIAQKQGYVETMFGRRRYLDELQSKNAAVRKFGERAAINAPIQGSASDLVKLAMIKVHQDLSCPMLLQVHDELLLESKNKDVEQNSARVRKNMESAAQLKVPLKVNVASGRNWEDAHA